MSLAKLHRTMPTTIWIYPTCCHTFGKSPTNVKDFQKIPTNSKRFHYNLENSNFPGGQSLLGDFSYFYNTWQTECLLSKSMAALTHGLTEEIQHENTTSCIKHLGFMCVKATPLPVAKHLNGRQ